MRLETRPWSVRRLVLLGALAATAALPLAGCGKRANERPDLILITLEGIAPGDLECYGGPDGAGARVCSLDDTGSRYVWAIASSDALAAAIASILTSRYPSHHRVGASAATFLRNDEQTLAETLRDAGYATAAFVDSPRLNRSRHLNQGFDRYESRSRRPAPDRDALAHTEAALEWLRATAPPRFLWLHLSSEDGTGEAAGEARRPSRASAGDPAVARVDAAVGHLLAGLESSGLRAGIVLTAGSVGPARQPKRARSPELAVLDSIRVPLLWSPPGGGAPTVIPAPVSTLDVAPTLLQSARVRRPEAFQGEPVPTWSEVAADDAAGADLPALGGRPVFAEGDGWTAVVVASRFLAVPDSEGPAGARTASALRPEAIRLRSSGRLAPEPDAAPAVAVLGEIVARFRETVARGGDPREGGVPEEIRQELRALGYLH